MHLFDSKNKVSKQPVPYWRAVLPEVERAESLGYHKAPCSIFLNVATMSPGDVMELKVTLHGNGTSDALWDIYVIEKVNEADNMGKMQTYLRINGSVYSRGKVVQFDVPEGPWRAHFFYTQRRGVAKKIVFLIRS